jgi:hypothetical protein
MAPRRKSEHDLDIFEVLAAMDERDSAWLERQSDEARKGFAAPVVLRWASAVGDGPEGEYYLRLVNERVNLGMWNIVDHPELLFRLLSSCGLGVRQRHQWIPPPGRARGSNKARDMLAQFHPTANDKELDLLLSIHTEESFTAFINECGCTAEEAKEALKAYGKRQETSAQARGKKERPGS